MTETVEQLLNRYKEIRHRLRYPPNAVPDTGIDLKRSKSEWQQPQSVSVSVSIQTPESQTPYSFSNVPAPFVRGLTFSSTVSIIAEQFGVTPDSILSDKRKKAISVARQVAMYLGWKQRKSFSWVGKQVKRDHTTVLYAVRKVEVLMQLDPEFRALVRSIEEKVVALHPHAFPADSEPHLETGEDGNVSLPSIPPMDQGGGSIILDQQAGSGSDLDCALCGNPAPAHD